MFRIIANVPIQLLTRVALIIVVMFPRLKLESNESPSSSVVYSCRFPPAASKIIIEVRASEIHGKSRIRERECGYYF